jgi:predicted phage terminase large subunit-like protein
MSRFDITYGDEGVVYDDDVIVIEPQEGPQEEFVACDYDIVIYGGEAGGGKTYGLLLQPLQYIDTPGFEAVIFRRTSKQVMNPGGLWDTAEGLYGYFENAEPRISNLQWRFYDAKKIISRVTFAHMEHEKNKLDWQGAEIPFIGFDELTHFSKTMFLYMLSRNRSMSGIPGKIRGTCNPDPDSFVRELIDWWIGEDGYVIEERCGLPRWLIADKGEFYQYNSEEELLNSEDGRWRNKIEVEAQRLERSFEQTKTMFIKTLTFIKASVEDNKKLLEVNPEYLANLNSLDYIEYMRLRKGNWNIRPSAGMYFKSEMFEIVPALPAKIKKTVRFWDRAATAKSSDNPDPDWTVGFKMSIDYDGFFYIEDIIRFRENPGVVERRIKNTAKQDGIKTFIRLEQEPGASGKSEVQHLIRLLAGYNAVGVPKFKNTETLVRPVSAQARANNIKIVDPLMNSGNQTSWIKPFLSEVTNHPDAAHDDQVVAFIGAFEGLHKAKKAGAW